jgi:hypothetical protein
MTDKDIQGYNFKLEGANRVIAAGLCHLIATALPNAVGKVWHGHPVWFLDGNPIVGYSLKKAGIEVLFWSGKSFKTDGLRPIGKYQAAGIYIETSEDIAGVASFMSEAVSIQWDYKDLPKLRQLEKLTAF